MPSLDEAYDDRSGLADSREAAVGLGLLSVGALAILAAIALVWFGSDTPTIKQYAGVTAGVGIPAMLLGVVAVLPANRRQRLGVVVGTVLAGIGVWLFWHVYPTRWTRTSDPLAFETLTLFGVGCAIALWFVFSAIASTRLRNNPHGTVSLEVITQGRTRTVELSRREYRELLSDGGDPETVIRELDDD